MASILQPTLQLEDWSLGYECPDLSRHGLVLHIFLTWLLGLQRSNGLNFSTKITKTHVLTWCGKCRAFVDPPCIFFGVGGVDQIRGQLIIWQQCWMDPAMK